MRRALLGVALLASMAGCGSDCDDSPQSAAVLVVGAFPAELAALLEHTEVESTTEVAGRTFRIGRIGGVPVIVGMTGIGLRNAAATTAAALDRFAVRGVVMSGVAGSPLRIADVSVPDDWSLADGSTYPAHRPWLAVARAVADSNAAALERCTLLPNDPERGPVCTQHEPVVVVGGSGESDDSFGDTPFACLPTGGDVFGCDADGAPMLPAAGALTLSAGGAGEPIAVDMESAAVAREAAARGQPFIAFRAVSDGDGDPLDLPGFPAQFFAYYRLAARNAAAATAAFLGRLGGG